MFGFSPEYCSASLRTSVRLRRNPHPATGGIDKPYNYRSLDSQHDRLIAKLKFNGRVRLYDLRHTALTRLAESDADPFSIQKIAGHSDIRVTSRYIHPTPEHIQKAFDRLATYNAKKVSKATERKAR